MQGKVLSKEVESKWLKGVPSHKRARVHNNFKTEGLLLKQKVEMKVASTIDLSTKGLTFLYSGGK